jgi:hypothetical protein
MKFLFEIYMRPITDNGYQKFVADINHTHSCIISGFCRDAKEITALLGFNAV